MNTGTLFLATILASATSASAGLLLSAGAPAGPINISGGPVTITVPLYIEQTAGTTVISNVNLGIYSVGAAVARGTGTANITGTERFNANFDDASFSVPRPGTPGFTASGATFTVQRVEFNGASSDSGKLQFGSLTLSIMSAGTTTFTLADNNANPNATDTLDGNLDPLDGLLESSSFSVTAVNTAVPEPSSAVLALVAASLLARRRRPSCRSVQ